MAPASEIYLATNSRLLKTFVQGAVAIALRECVSFHCEDPASNPETTGLIA